MAFLAPALLAGLLAIAIPIVVHLVQRERRTVVAFPSLMFLRRIPTQSVRRRAIRHWPLLALRVAAFALIAVAFARPFLSGGATEAAATSGTREVVVLVDRSASMGYQGHWPRAQEAARRVIRGLAPGDRASVVFFAADVEIAARADGGPAALLAAIDRAEPGPGLTRYGPALRAAAGLLDTSTANRREVVLVSDFQKSGWDPAQDARLPPGVVLTPTSVAEQATSNAAVVGLTFVQQPAAKGVLVTASARVVNHAATPVANREITLSVDGHRVDSQRVSVGPGAPATVAFTPFVIGGARARVTARLAPDQLPADDVFNAVVTAGGRVPVLIVESVNPAPDASLYLARALGVAAAPGFDTRVTRADGVQPEDISAAAVVVLNDSRVPTGAAGRALAEAVNAGTGLLVLLGERSAWSPDDPDLLPGRLGAPVDRSGTSGGSLGSIDFSHPVFEIFSSPRSGDLTAARVFRYRTLTAAGKVLARFDDGAVAVAERRVGSGSVVAWTSTLDSYWNDLPLKPVFVPFVHQLMRHLGRYVEPRPWYTVGEAYDPADAPPASPGARPVAGGAFTAVSPTGRAVEPAAGSGTRTVPLAETGFYEIRPAGSSAEPLVVAVNGAVAESDLAPIDPAALLANVTPAGAASGGASRGRAVTVEEGERHQSLWWYLLVVGLWLLVVEAVVASRLPRIA
jgi:hypothetical protein